MCMAETKYIIFEVDTQVYSMNLQYVREIEENYTMIPIPNCPADIRGIVHLRGEVVPVYSLRSRFGMDESREPGKIILTYVHEHVIGFEVDAICGIESVSPEGVMEVPRLLMSDETTYIDCILQRASGIVVNISVENILSESEVEAINQSISEQEAESKGEER